LAAICQCALWGWATEITISLKYDSRRQQDTERLGADLAT
jgi:hypothetical protein